MGETRLRKKAYGRYSIVRAPDRIRSQVSILTLNATFSFTKPQSRRDWRSLGVFSAFIVALATLIMFPILVYFYVRLARREEREAAALFGDVYENYMRQTPAFIPGFNITLIKEEKYK